MIHTITTSTGRTIHVAPDNEPVFNHSEITAMVGTAPDVAEILSLVKEIFPGSKIERVQHDIPEREERQMAFLGFNASEQEEMKDFELIPPGEYRAVIADSEMVANSAGTGHYLKVEFNVIEGEHNGRKVFANLNLDNPNQTAVDIARSELKSICAAVGKGNDTIQDSSELHNIPLTIKVKHEARKDKPGEFSAKIAKYAPAGGGTTTSAPKGGVPKTGSKPPWVK